MARKLGAGFAGSRGTLSAMVLRLQHGSGTEATLKKLLA
jgi:hypothetical protein